MQDSFEKQQRDILAMKRVAREVFYPKSELEFIHDVESSDQAFIPRHIKEEGKLSLQDYVDHVIPSYDDIPVEAFMPEISQLGDIALAKDVFFPQSQDDDVPAFISNYYADIEQLIQECQSAINAGHISYAKKTYTELRLLFLSSQIAVEDKENLYAQIQSIYDQITLKTLEEEARKRL
jgi:hypothetical protein